MASRKRYKWLGVALAVVLIGAAGEGIVRLTSHGRSAGLLRPGHRAVILCAGDSFTVVGYPGGSYPEALQRLLRARGLARARAVNVGVVGENTKELCARLPGYLRAYRPDLLLLMTGVNDAWNRAGPPCREPAAGNQWLESLALYRAVRRAIVAWRKQRLTALPEPRRIRFGKLFSVVNFTGTVDTIRHRPGASLSDEELRGQVRRNVGVLLKVAAAAGVPTVVMTYPVWGHGPTFPGLDPAELEKKRAALRAHFIAANRGLREAAIAAGVPVIEGQGAERFAEGPPARWWNWATLHPARPLQEAMAANVITGLERLGLFAAAHSGPPVRGAAGARSPRPAVRR